MTNNTISVSEIEYPLGDALPAIGASIELAPGLKWLRMRLPFALDHINLWLLRDEFEGVQGWTIIDCGIANDETRDAWEAIFGTQLEGLPILRILVTHMHPDHVGLAQWLCERWKAPLWMSMSDYLTSLWLTNKVSEKSADFFQKHGLSDPDDLDKVRARANYYSNMVPGLPRSFRRIMDGETIMIGGRGWRIIMGYGHAPEHACLYCESLGILISGDMVLPRISTNVSVYESEPDGDPLGLYLNSLERFETLPADTYVLPSHGKPFKGMNARIRQLQEHHVERLSEAIAACQLPRHAREIVPILFKRQLDIHQMTFAMGEAIAHLNHLQRQGKLHRELCADGVLRFSLP